MYQNHEYKNRFRILKGGLISLVVASNLYSAPSGGTVVSGNATINQNGNTTNINQSSQKASINWQDFSISKNETVNFNQPNANSITLNRVIGNEKSIIDGALNANGQVWILNSNGTLFGKNAKVNTSGLLVTTKELSDDDFQKGNYSFKGNSKESIENQGDINLNDKAYTVFVANSVINNGEIKVHKGNVHLVGADEFSITLNENQNISLKVTKGTLNSLVENNNLIVANGGNVYLTTNAKNELLKGVVNNTGIIEAASLDDLQSEVILFAHGGTANIDGEIKAKNSFVETSGENLSVKDSFKITANKWLLDPVNMTIEANGGSDFNSGSVSATAIQNALSGTNLELQADNNITVNQNIVWSTDKQLKLTADSINVNATINNTNSTNGGVYFQAANTTDKVVFDTNGKVIVNNINQMQWIETALNGKYELGSNIDAGATKTDTAKWGTTGFNPIGNATNIFKGTFDGKGFTISDLYINRPTQDYIGLFGYTNSATIKNIGLENLSITGQSKVGGLVGDNTYGTISNSYASGTVSGNNYVGGLVGDNVYGKISNSYASGTVSSGTNSYIGGLVGVNRGTIENSYASGTVKGGVTNMGGLVGYNSSGTITNSFYDKETNINSMDDSVYGKTKAEIATALKSASSEWETDLSKGRGYGTSGTTDLPFLKNVTKLLNRLFEDGHGTALNPYTITNWTQLQNINNSNILTKNYYFNLLNNLNSSSSGYMGNSGEGWNPIGNFPNIFVGTFDGKGFTISDLYINRPTQDYIGLFGYINNSATIKNIGLENLNIRGNNIVGGLVGGNFASGTIENSYASGTVSGNNIVGGLVGGNFAFGKISNSYASGTVLGNGDFSYVGGFVGQNIGIISNSYASGIVVSESSFAGGLIGWNNGGIITNSYYDKETNQADMRDKTYHGKTKAEILFSFSNISGWGTTGGGASVSGYEVVLLPYLLGVTKDEYKSKSILFNGGFGTEANPYTITNWTQLQNINNSNIVSSSYYFNLLNNLNSLSSGYIGDGEGWNPIIGSNGFIGTFDGLGHTISDLYINRPTQDFIGLFGYTEKATIKNIGLENLSISGKNYVGGLVGDKNSGKILNSYASGTVIGNGIFSTVGGLVGWNNGGTISNSYASGTVFGNGNSSTVGGLVGWNGGSIENSYALGSVGDSGGDSNVGGLVGDKSSGTISKSFYDKTKYSGDGVGAGSQTGVAGLSTEEMKHGTVYKTAGWDIVADSTLVEGTPVIKFDSVNNKYVWAIAPKTFTANLGNQSTNYNGLLQNLSSIYTSQAIFGKAGVNFKFVDVDNNDITAYKNAGTYSNIGVVLTGTDEFTFAVVGKKGTLTINKANLTVTANDKSKKQGENNPSLTYVANGLIGDDTLSGNLYTNATQNSEVGSYDIEKGSLDNPNYEIDFKKGKLIVEAKPETPKPVEPTRVQDVVDSISHQIAQTIQVESQIDNQILNINQNTQTVSFNKRYGVEIINGGINAPTKEEEARNFQNMINK
ncbi:GLUG motif-containing protein [Aliarcobacter vitoriensis]|uniref:GLUG motif-containing protein n=2 Tax=Aliarcobacter TaxID=2321111 RepID=UPI003AADA7A4